MATDLLFTFFLVVLNGFFVAAEFSLVKVRASQLDLKASKGSQRAVMGKNLVENLEAYLSATQLGITLASLALGWVGEGCIHELVVHIFHLMGITVSETGTTHTISVVLAFSLITFMHITFGEQIPKMIGIRFSLATTMFIAWPMRIFYTVFRPFIWTLNKVSNSCLRLLGIQPADEGEVHSEEELRLLLTESEEGGAIKPSEHELIQNVFDFDDRVVKQIMVNRPKISAINVETGKDHIVRLIIEEGYSRLPVYLGDLDNVLGIVHTKDLLKAVIDNKFRSIKDIMRPAHFVPETMKVNDLLRDFQKMHIQFAMVTNEFGGIAGIITMEDIIEELVGEIQDEHDEEKPNVEKISDQEYILKAQVSISDANESLPIAIPENPNYDTVSGFINSLFGRIPGVHEKRTFGGYEFTILQRKKQSVESVRLRVMDMENIS